MQGEQDNQEQGTTARETERDLWLVFGPILLFSALAAIIAIFLGFLPVRTYSWLFYILALIGIGIGGYIVYSYYGPQRRRS